MELFQFLLGWALIILIVALGPVFAIGAVTAGVAGAGTVSAGAARGDRKLILAGLLPLIAIAGAVLLNLQAYGMLNPGPLPPPPAPPARPGPRIIINSDWDRLQSARMAVSGHFTAVYRLQVGRTEPNGEELIATTRLGNSDIVDTWRAGRVEITRTPACLAALRGPARGRDSIAPLSFWRDCYHEVPTAWSGTGPADPMYLIRSHSNHYGFSPGTFEIWLKEGDRITLVRRCGAAEPVGAYGVPDFVTRFINLGRYVAVQRARQEYLQCVWATKDQLNAGTL